MTAVAEMKELLKGMQGKSFKLKEKKPGKLSRN
jgi:hypothetical protein